MGKRERYQRSCSLLLAVAWGTAATGLLSWGATPAHGVANPFHAKTVTVSFPATGMVRVSVTAATGIAEGQTGTGFVGEFVHLERTGATSTVSFANPDGVTGPDGSYTTSYTGSGAFDAKSCNRPGVLASYCVTASATG